MSALIGFMRAVASMPLPARAWVLALGLTNLASLLFIRHVEAQVVLAAMVLAAAIQSAIFSRLGFVRLLGAGHLHWIPMLGWLLTRLETIGSEPAFSYWIIALFVMNGVSLLIDLRDLGRYALWEREPYI